MSNNTEQQVSLGYLVKIFLKIGTISFGGFMALIGVLQKEMVERDKKLHDEVLMDGVSLASMLPGPVAVNTVGYVGYQLRGFWGAIISMAAVILPSFILVLGLAVVYLEYGDIENFQSAINLVMPAIVAIIIQVGVNMGKKHLGDWKQYLIAILAFAAIQLLGGFWTTIGVLVISSFVGLLFFSVQSTENANVMNSAASHRTTYFGIAGLIILSLVAAILADAMETEGLKMNVNLLGTFSGMSITLFGGGYVIIPIIQETIVSELSWLTNEEFNTAIAFSQITPGPILISATFIGYKIASWPGAVFATVGIFLPSGLLMIFCSHYLNIVKTSKVVMAMFKGLRPAIIGMVFSGAVTIGLGINNDWITIASFLACLLLAIRFKLSAILLILVSVAIGVIGMI